MIRELDINQFDINIINNPELAFAVLCIFISFFCGRISLVFARGNIKDYDFFSLIIGLIANVTWLSSIVWFWFASNWIIPIVSIIISLFGFNMLVLPERLILWKLRNVFRIISISCLFGMWHTYFL